MARYAAGEIRDLWKCTSSEAEVEKKNLARRADLQIGWFNIAVNNTFFMKVSKCIEHLIGPLQNFVYPERNLISFELYRKIIPRNELHSDIPKSVLREMIKHMRQRTVLQFRQK